MSQYIQANQANQKAFFQQLKKYYSFYTIGFLAFLFALAVAEQMGMSRKWIGYWFLFATIALYAAIGIMARTVDAAEYYVAGRRVPAFFNGMATGADWMSAASFIGMAGTLYLAGFDGLAWVMGWTAARAGGALPRAYLRKSPLRSDSSRALRLQHHPLHGIFRDPVLVTYGCARSTAWA